MAGGGLHAKMNKTVHQVPRVMTMGGRDAGTHGNTGLDNGQQFPTPHPSGKTRPFGVYKMTRRASPAEYVDHDQEGPPAPRHKSHASSK